MNRKGLSQVLSLIIAASVLMMTALTVIFMVQGGLGGANSERQVAACKNAIQSKCSITGTPAGRTVSTPSNCLSGGELKPEVKNSLSGRFEDANNVYCR